MEEVKQRKPKVSKYTEAEKLVRAQESHQRYYQKNKEKIRDKTANVIGLRYYIEIISA